MNMVGELREAVISFCQSVDLGVFWYTLTILTKAFAELWMQICLRTICYVVIFLRFHV